MIYSTIIGLFLVLDTLSSSTFSNLPHSSLTSYEGEISCNSQVSGIIKNYGYHAYTFNVGGAGCTISANFNSSNNTLIAGIFNSNGIIMGKSNVVLSVDDDSTYYIQLKGDNKYEFELKCGKDCESRRRLNEDDPNLALLEKEVEELEQNIVLSPPRRDDDDDSKNDRRSKSKGSKSKGSKSGGRRSSTTPFGAEGLGGSTINRRRGSSSDKRGDSSSSGKRGGGGGGGCINGGCGSTGTAMADEDVLNRPRKRGSDSGSRGSKSKSGRGRGSGSGRKKEPNNYEDATGTFGGGRKGRGSDSGSRGRGSSSSGRRGPSGQPPASPVAGTTGRPRKGSDSKRDSRSRSRSRSGGRRPSGGPSKALFEGGNTDQYGLNGNSNGNNMEEVMVSLSPSSIANLWVIFIVILVVNVILFSWYYYKKNKNVSTMNGHKYQKTDVDEPDF